MDDAPYTLVERRERVAGHDLDLVTLHDFEATVDALCRRQDSAAARWWLEDGCPMFGVIWPAARAACRRVAADPTIPGAPLLELGCGLALPSLIAARRGGHPVPTDLHPDAAAFLTRNCERNDLPALPFTALDWRTPEASGLAPRSFARVVASDILYFRDHPPLVAAMFDRFLADDGVGWLADPGRPHLQAFHDAARALGLRVHVDVDGDADDAVFLLTVTRDPGSASGG
jgi:predicted nicotinamide N-methyase